MSSLGGHSWLESLDLSSEEGKADARRYVEQEARRFNPDVTDAEISRAINFDNPDYFVKRDLATLATRPSKYIPRRSKSLEKKLRPGLNRPPAPPSN